MDIVRLSRIDLSLTGSRLRPGLSVCRAIRRMDEQFPVAFQSISSMPAPVVTCAVAMVGA